MPKYGIEEMKRTKRLRLTFIQRMDYYFPSLIYLFLSLYFLISESLASSRSDEENRMVLLVFSFLSVVSLYIKRRCLRFKKIEIKCDISEFKEVLSRLNEDLDWKIDENRGNYLRLLRLEGGSCEIVTIIRLKDGLLINSIPYYERNYHFSLRNAENIRMFLKHLIDVKNGIPYQRLSEKEKNEFSFKRMFVRIVMLLSFAMLCCICLLSLSSFFCLLFVFPLFGFWFYSDIKLLMQRRKKIGQRQ